MNRFLGWLLLLASVASAMWLDFWPVVQGNLPSSSPMPRLAGVVGIAFVQIAISRTYGLPLGPLEVRQIAAWLTGLGALTYASGAFLEIRWAAAAWLILVGTLLNLAGFLLIWRTATRWQSPRGLRMILAVFCFAMFGLVVVESAAAIPELLLGIPLGSGPDMRSRMLRLARAAAATLPVLTLLYHRLTETSGPSRRAVPWGSITLAVGTILMPTTLIAAAVAWPGLRFMLPIPAVAILVGVMCARGQARQHERLLERWGWVLIAGSMAGGLLAGMVAFGGPLPPPGFFDPYDASARQVFRLIHIHAIVVGLACICISRDLEGRSRGGKDGS